MLKSIAAALALSLAASASFADGISVAEPRIRAMLPNQPVASAYLQIRNAGTSDDRLMGATSTEAERVELHEMKMDGTVMQMRQVEAGIAVPAGTSAVLEPGEMHLMLIGPSRRFVEGESVPVILQFEQAGSVAVEFPVVPAEAAATRSTSAPADHSEHRSAEPAPAHSHGTH